MKEILFWTIVFDLLLSNILLIVSIARPELRFWPPPDPSTWRYRVTRITGVFGPFAVVGILVLGVLDSDSAMLMHPGRFLVGGILFAGGGGFALWGYLGLGLRASQGQYEGLIASGAYHYSRNPQYVGTMVSFLGYAIACNSLLTFVTWAIWSAWFVMAPFAEEPWLREKLGPAYEEYAAEVPRFLGWRRVRTRTGA